MILNTNYLQIQFLKGGKIAKKFLLLRSLNSSRRNGDTEVETYIILHRPIYKPAFKITHMQFLSFQVEETR
jgi:hypothetical protein